MCLWIHPDEFFGVCRLDMTKGWRLQGNNNKCHQTPWRPNASHHLQPLKAIPVHIIPLAHHNNNQVHKMLFVLNHHPHARPTLLRLYQQHQIPPKFSNFHVYMCVCTGDKKHGCHCIEIHMTMTVVCISRKWLSIQTWKYMPQKWATWHSYICWNPLEHHVETTFQHK